MDRLFKSVLSIRELKFHVDDDHVDRLSRQYDEFQTRRVTQAAPARPPAASESSVHGHHPHLLCVPRQHEAVRRPSDQLLVPRGVHRQPRRLHQLHLLGHQHVLPADVARHPRAALQHARVRRRTAAPAAGGRPAERRHAAHQLLPVGAADPHATSTDPHATTSGCR